MYTIILLLQIALQLAEIRIDSTTHFVDVDL